MSDTEPAPLSMADRFRKQNEAARETVTPFAKDAHLDENPNGSWVELRHLSRVITDLPKFHKQSLTDIIGNLLPKSIVWDLGSGDRAVALSELVAQYPDHHLKGIGVTLPVERENLQHPDNVDVVRMDVDEYLRTFDRSQRPNLIYISKLLRWVPHPLSTLKKAYNALALNGILLVDEVLNLQSPLYDKTGEPVEPSNLEAVLKEQGYDVEIVSSDDDIAGIRSAYSFAIRKTENHPSLNLPIRAVPPEQLGKKTTKETQYVYEFLPPQAVQSSATST